MITLVRAFRLLQLKVKWHLAFYQFLDQQLKNPEEIQQKLIHEIVELVHKSNEPNT